MNADSIHMQCIIVIIIGNGHCDQNSNLGQGHLHLEKV